VTGCRRCDCQPIAALQLSRFSEVGLSQKSRRDLAPDLISQRNYFSLKNSQTHFTLFDSVSHYTPPSIQLAPTAYPAMAAPRTLLLCPPSLSAHPEALDKIYEIHDRSTADLQMLDRIAAGLVQLPATTYDVVLLLTDADGTTRESHKLLARDVASRVASSLKVGGILKGQDGILDGSAKTEAILAGLSESPNGMVKTEQVESVSIPLKFGKKKANGVNGTNDTNGTVNPDGSVPINLNGKRNQPEPVKPAGVGFVDFSDDLDDPIVTGEDDDDLIDEDDLITEEDMARPVIQREYITSTNSES
jgi:hypothetical protein